MRGSPKPWKNVPNVIGIIPAHAGLTSPARYRVIKKRDHPRACGAHCELSVRRALCLGSSPRMRGSRFINILVRVYFGIIPAHAGLTESILIISSMRRDHPRACGAHYFPCFQATLDEGSSPRMRGSRAHVRELCVLPGIIPAHAGLTLIGCVAKALQGDHPRACGAHFEQVYDEAHNMGSSPRMRGSHDAVSLSSLSVGIIPAHAGLTNWTKPFAGG